jgi:hypothetical protein
MGSMNSNRIKFIQRLRSRLLAILLLAPFGSGVALAQDASKSGPAPDVHVSARMDAREITVGDQVRLFLEAKNLPGSFALQWPAIPDTFNHLEVVERGKIDTIQQADAVIYKQRIILTGFDSGTFLVPSFPFNYNSTQGASAVLVKSDSFSLLVQTVAVDTTKQFRGIKGIIYVKSTWLDYIWVIIGGVVFIVLLVVVIIYFLRNKKVLPPKPQGPVETLQEYTLRLLKELDTRQLWQKKQVKEYYVELTGIVRNYIEARFKTSALELTTDEILAKALEHKELHPYHDLLSVILNTADLAKFAKFQPMPQEHIDTMDKAKQFVETSKPAPVVVIEGAEPSQEKTNPTE